MASFYGAESRYVTVFLYASIVGFARLTSADLLDYMAVLSSVENRAHRVRSYCPSVSPSCEFGRIAPT